MSATKGPIGVFDSGYGGLTVLKEIVKRMPQYDYIYLGDNARAPYGPRSFTTVYNYTWECTKWFFRHGCSLVILACNTASAKALRTIQQNDLPHLEGNKRVLGVIRPTTEQAGKFTKTGEVGILGTKGTVQSQSYVIEIKKFYPEIKVFQEACSMWVPLIENNEHKNAGADYFIKKYLDNLLAQTDNIDTILLACTHYPLIKEQIVEMLPGQINVISQGAIVAESLANYLQRHPGIEEMCSHGSFVRFYTTDSAEDFDEKGSLFYEAEVRSAQVDLSAQDE